MWSPSSRNQAAGETGIGHNPFEQPCRLDVSLLGDDRKLTLKAIGICRRRQVFVGEDIGKVVTALAIDPLGIDCEPTPFAEIEDVAVMDVAVENAELLWCCKQSARDLPAIGKGAAMRARCRLQTRGTSALVVWNPEGT